MSIEHTYEERYYRRGRERIALVRRSYSPRYAVWNVHKQRWEGEYSTLRAARAAFAAM